MFSLTLPILTPRDALVTTTGTLSPSGLRVLNTMRQALLQQVTATTYAHLPSPATEGMVYAVTDSTVNTWGSTIAGGGTNHVLAYFNGVNWTVVGK